MSPFLSRILVAVPGLVVTLGAIWLGGWWLASLAIVAALFALHEYFRLTRRFRPAVLAGFLGGLLTLLGAQLGGLEWALGGFLATMLLAFGLKGISQTRGSPTVSASTTLLGTAWIALGLAHVILIRDLPENGRLAAMTVLIAVFAADTTAYLAGRLFGRHRMAPRVSPGKTWEGFVVGSAVCIFVTWDALYPTDFLDDPRALALGAGVAVAAALGDLFESGIKRDVEVKDAGRLLGGHGGVLDRLDSILFAAPAAYYLILALESF